jgi:hypothetical protein
MSQRAVETCVITSFILLGGIILWNNFVLTTHIHAIPERTNHIICTYFVTLGKSEYQDKENREMLALWEDSWGKQGWTTKILTEKDAKLHPNFKEIFEAVSSLPTVHSKDFSMACYLRWVAAVSSECTVLTLISNFFLHYFLEPTLTSAAVDVRL